MVGFSSIEDVIAFDGSDVLAFGIVLHRALHNHLTLLIPAPSLATLGVVVPVESRQHAV